MAEDETAEVVVALDFDEEKKHSRRFKEVPIGNESRIGTLYVPRTTLAAIGNPDRLEIVIRARQD